MSRRTSRIDSRRRRESLHDPDYAGIMTEDILAAVITVSNRCSRGERVDRGGPMVAEMLKEAGYTVAPVNVIPDGTDVVESAIRAALAAGARLILTTGGTGISPQDLTPEGTERVLERQLPGLVERIRREGAEEVPTAVLSRALAGVAGRTLIVNAPGSFGGAVATAKVVIPLAPHVLDQLDGGDHV